MNISQSILSGIAKITNPETAHAHCDVPCGIYDPHHAQVAALTVIRMMDIIIELQQSHKSDELEFQHNLIRATKVKEEHAELCKHEIRGIWGDYFKQEHFDKYPELHGLVHQIMQAGSKSRQTVDRGSGMKLLETVNRFAEIFWESKGKATKRVKAPYKPGEEIVVPVLE